MDLSHTEIKITVKCKSSLAMISGWEKGEKNPFLTGNSLWLMRYEYWSSTKHCKNDL